MHRDERVTDEMVELARKAHASQFGRMDPEIQFYVRQPMRTALSAALSEQTLPVRVALDDIVNDEKLTLEVSAFLLERDQQTTQDERDEAERETSAFMISQMVARHIRSACFC